MRQYRIGIVLIALFLAVLTVTAAWAAAQDFLPPVRESEAYRLYKKRPPSELSRIIYLIDRCKGTELQVLYDGTFYNAEVAVPIARWFLSVYYRKQTAEQWVKQYCTSTIPYGNPIRIKLPDNTFRISRDFLLDELSALKKVESEDGQRTV